MPSLSKFKFSKKTWFSLSLTGLLFATIIFTQFAARTIRDNRSQAAGTTNATVSWPDALRFRNQVCLAGTTSCQPFQTTTSNNYTWTVASLVSYDLHVDISRDGVSWDGWENQTNIGTNCVGPATCSYKVTWTQAIYILNTTLDNLDHNVTRPTASYTYFNVPPNTSFTGTVNYRDFGNVGNLHTTATISDNTGACTINCPVNYAISASGGTFCSANNAYVKLTWTSNTGDTNYNIWKDGAAITSGPNPWTSTAEVGGQSHTWAVESVSKGVTSNTVSVTTASGCTLLPPTVNISASSTSIPYNSPVQIHWVGDANATSCGVVSNPPGFNWSGLNATGTATLTASTTFTVTCSGQGGTGSPKSVSVTVQPAPTADIKANGSDAPAPITYNTGVIISWTSSNASSCSVTGTSNTATSGSFASGNLTASKTYSINCRGATDQVLVNVAGQPLAPSVNIKANNSDGPITISNNTAATLTWTIANATSCSASASMPAGNWSSGGSNSSGLSTGILISNKTYSITCGSAADSVTINVSSPPSCSSNCGGSNPPGSPPSNPPAPPKVIPPSAKPDQQPVAGTNDLKLTFASNPFLVGSMDISLIIDGTPINQTASVSKEGGTLVIKVASLLTKNTAYILKAFSKNSLVQKVSFTYTNNTSLNFAAFVTGDFNNDNMIDNNDILLLVPAGIKSGENIYDINYDGVVNSIDYSLLLINQGKKGN